MCGVIPVVFVFSLMLKYCVTNYFYFSHSIHKTKALRTSTLLCSFLAIKRKVEVDLTRTVQQIYEEERTKQRAESDTVMSDFVEVKSTLSRLRTIKNNKKKATNINEIVVDNTETSKGEKFQRRTRRRHRRYDPYELRFQTKHHRVSSVTSTFHDIISCFITSLTIIQQT
jgi:hypothetical protein